MRIVFITPHISVAGFGKGLPVMEKTIQYFGEKIGWNKVKVLVPTNCHNPSMFDEKIMKAVEYIRIPKLIMQEEFDAVHAFWSRKQNIMQKSIMRAFEIPLFVSKAISRVSQQVNNDTILYGFMPIGAEVVLKSALKLVRNSDIKPKAVVIRLLGLMEASHIINNEASIVRRILHSREYHTLPNELKLVMDVLPTQVIITKDGTMGAESLLRLGVDASIIEELANGNDFPRIDDSLITKKTDIRPLRLISVGRVVSWKRYDLIVEIANLLKHKQVRFHWKIVGDGDYLNKLRRLAKEKGLTDEIELIGFVGNCEVPPLLQEAHILISMNDIGNQGNNTIEALMSGNALILRNTGDNSAVLKDGCNGFLVNNPVEAANRISELENNRAKLEVFMKESRSLSLEFPKWQERLAREFAIIEERILKFRTHINLTNH